MLYINCAFSPTNSWAELFSYNRKQTLHFIWMAFISTMWNVKQNLKNKSVKLRLDEEYLNTLEKRDFVLIMLIEVADRL